MPNCWIKKGSFEINKKCHFFSKCVKVVFCSEAVIRSALLNNECHEFPKQRVIKYTVNVNKINVYLLNTRKCTCLIFMNNDFELKKKYINFWTYKYFIAWMVVKEEKLFSY